MGELSVEAEEEGCSTDQNRQGSSLPSTTTMAALDLASSHPLSSPSARTHANVRLDEGTAAQNERSALAQPYLTQATTFTMGAHPEISSISSRVQMKLVSISYVLEPGELSPS